jgi:AcrR family transcriptional regulator
MGNSDAEAPEARRRRARIEAILDAAALLFAGDGYERTSLGDVADKVDLTPKALYHYYGSKRDLLEAVLVREFNYFDPEVLAAARTKWHTLSLVDALTESSVEALRDLFEHGELLRVSFTESLHGSETTRRRHDNFQRNWIKHVTAIVSSYDDVPARRRNAFADHLVAILFGTAVDAILRSRPEVVGGQRGTEPSRRYVRSIVTDLLEGVLTPDTSANRAPRRQPTESRVTRSARATT